jgi:hypothetical protein
VKKCAKGAVLGAGGGAATSWLRNGLKAADLDPWTVGIGLGVGCALGQF